MLCSQYYYIKFDSSQYYYIKFDSCINKQLYNVVFTILHVQPLIEIILKYIYTMGKVQYMCSFRKVC